MGLPCQNKYYHFMHKTITLFLTQFILLTATACPVLFDHLGHSNKIDPPSSYIANDTIQLPDDFPAIADTATGSNPYAVIAGGSKGIGYAIAEALARRGYNLVLIARHLDSLIATKKKLESTYPIHVEVLQMDLAKDK